jgi:hypothetical protein
MLGGWTSLAFLLYWRWIEEISPMNISKAYKKKHIKELATDFKQFCRQTTILQTFQSTTLMQMRIGFMTRKQSTMCRDLSMCIYTCMPTSLKSVIFLDIRKRRSLTTVIPVYQVKSVRQITNSVVNFL